MKKECWFCRWWPKDKKIILLKAIADDIKFIKIKEIEIMGKLEDALTVVTELGVKVDALNTALDGYREAVQMIKDELEALKTGAELPPLVEGKVQEIIDAANVATTKVDETYAENFPTV